MAIGTLRIDWSDGSETYALARATIHIVPGADRAVVLLYVQADDQPPVTTRPDGDRLATRPNAEVEMRLPAAEAVNLAGRRFSVPASWDEQLGDHVSSIYYYEHGDLNDNEVEFLAQDGPAVKIRWAGTAANLDEPTPAVVVEAWFTPPVSGRPADA